MPIIDFHGAVLDFDLITDESVGSRYESQEVEQALDLFAAGDRVVVAGAGTGWLAAVIAAIVGPKNVLCIEPIAHLSRLVEQNVAVDGVPLRCEYGALTPDGMPAALSYNQENWALSNTLGSGHIRVPGLRLIDVLERGYDCVALDVEGLEGELLTESVASGLRKLLIEFHNFAIGDDAVEGIRKRLEHSGLQPGSAVTRVSPGGERGDIESWTR
jgi:FkbM family methyltransferase